MIFYTESESIYELDRSQNRIRRLEGSKNPTPRQGPDGEWKTFEYCSEVREGKPVLIQWEGSRSTLTSRIKIIATANGSSSN